jgi:two-component system, NarL family, invasion response regulator UvrY
MTKPVTVLLIDDHAVVRAGCRLLLQQRNWEILEATTGKEGLDVNARVQPELIVLDLGLPDAGGLDILKKLISDNDQARILVFTMHEDPVLAMRALEGGAHGYITKGDGPDSFMEAVEELLKGGNYLSRVIAQKVALMNIRSGDHPLKDLTAREIDVLQLLGCGKGLDEIANALQISYRTVANTVSIIKRKLNVTTHVKLMQIAIEYAKSKY